LVAVLGILLSWYAINFKQVASPTLQLDISSYIDNLGNEAVEIFEETKDYTFQNQDEEHLNYLRKDRWFLLAFEGEETVYWNTNKLNLDSSVIHAQTYPLVYNYGDDVYIVFAEKNRYLAHRLANDGKLHQEVFEYHPVLREYGLFYNFNDSKTSTNFTLDFVLLDQSNLLFLTATFVAILLLLILFVINYRSNSRWIWLPFILLILGYVTALWISKMPLKEFTLIHNEAFSLLNNETILVLCLLHTALTFMAMSLVFRLSNKLPTFVHVLLASILLFFVADLVIDLGVRIVSNGTLNFNFNQLFEVETLSYLTLAVIVLAFASLVALIFLSKIHRHTFTHWHLIFAGALAFVLFQFFDAHRGLLHLMRPIFFVLFAVAIFRYVTAAKIRIYSQFSLIALTLTFVLYHGNLKKENEATKQLASQLLKNRDLNAENILKSFENQLAFEFLTPVDYSNFEVRKDLIESRIKQLYFSNYLEKYELKLLSFDPEGNNINSNTLYSFPYLDSVFNTNTLRTASDYFYRIKNPEAINGYIAKYENCDLEGNYGTTFIILQPRIVQSEFLYPEVFANQEDEELELTDNYNYGIYFNNKLISQKGTYAYALNRLPKSKHQKVFKQGNYKVAISSNQNHFRLYLSGLTFILLIMLPLAFLLSLLAGLLIGKTHVLASAFVPWSSRFLSARIQTSLTILLLAALLVSVYFIITYITANYNQKLENELLTRVKNISTQVQNNVDLNAKLQNAEQRRLILNRESSTYKVDVNLFDTNGKLIESTKPYLFDNEVLSRNINPHAYKQLLINQYSQLMLKEELEGSEYISAYVPLFDSKNQVIGYLNTPYFAKNKELNNQLSSLVVNVLNIYFLLLLTGIVVAIVISRQISKPLLLIQDKIAHTELGIKNELIRYDRDDEIGRLVKQYNKMVLELDDSAKQLAESEREGAWREMAKQVAHEIKNPLTPMKLSIQHLQRAYTNGPSEKLDALFNKTSKLLIDQINSLSTMASEFSNFAKMPEGTVEVMDVSQALKDTVNLFVQSENVSITEDIAPNIKVRADKEQLKRVFNNLLKNAIQAIPNNREGAINITLKRSDKMALIRVSDNGSGIPKELHKKVFVPNFSTKSSGMGLGLAISKKIIQQAKGNIGFVSEVDKGTTFEILLPLV
jgi:two-component system nitrogen regulation sensor histidine kinase NtrY